MQIVFLILVVAGIGLFLMYQTPEKADEPKIAATLEKIVAPPKVEDYPREVTLLVPWQFQSKETHGTITTTYPASTVVSVSKIDSGDVLEVARGTFKSSIQLAQTDFMDRANLARDKREVREKEVLRENAIAQRKALEEAEKQRKQVEFENADRIDVTILQVLADGSLATLPTGRRVFLRGVTNFNEGVRATIVGYPSGSYEYTTVLGAHSKIESWKVITKY